MDLKSGHGLADKRKTLGMPDGLNRQVDVQFRPVKMIGRWQFDMEDFANRHIAKPREFREG